MAGMSMRIVDDFECDRRESLSQLNCDLLFNAHRAASTLTVHLSLSEGVRAILVVTSATSHNADSMKLDSKFFDRLRVLRREKEGGMEALLMAMATGYDYRKYQRVKALEKRGSK